MGESRYFIRDGYFWRITDVLEFIKKNIKEVPSMCAKRESYSRRIP